MRAWLKQKTEKLFKSKEVDARESMDEAQSNTEEIGQELRSEIQTLAFELETLQRQLAHEVHNNGSIDRITELTRRIKMLQRNLDAKRRLLSNMEKEKQQLIDASVNLKVTKAMKNSLDAQKKLAKIHFDDEEGEIDSLLDDIDEHRSETRDLTDRLGQFGVDSDDQIADSSDLQPDDVLAAMGYSTSKQEHKTMTTLKKNYGDILKAEFLSDMALQQQAKHASQMSSPKEAEDLDNDMETSSIHSMEFPQAPSSIQIKSKVDNTSQNYTSTNSTSTWGF